MWGTFQLRRRTFLRWCLRACALAPAAASAVSRPFGVSELIATRQARIVSRHQRHFRVHAAVLVLGVPVFKREDVGAGCASVEHAADEEGSVVALQFAAGSQPQRARGLNRFGVLREAAVHQGGLLTGAAYAGFMTTSAEKNLEQASAALNSSGPAIPCTFSSGYSAPGRTEQTHGRFLVPSVNHWKDAAAILSSVEQHRPGGSAEFRPVGPRATFLYAVHAAIRNPAPRARMQFCHNGEHHELVTEKQPASMHLAGAILDQSGVRCSEFTIRLDPSDPSGIPTHIEFRAKSYLRLTFEAVPAGPETASLPWLLKEELA